MHISLATEPADAISGAIIKGILFSYLPDVRIVDIPMGSPYLSAAYMLRHSYAYFPEGVIHIIFLAGKWREETPYTIARCQGRYFVGLDNSIFGLLFDDPDCVIRLEGNTGENGHGLDPVFSFVPAVIQLASGKRIDNLGKPYTGYRCRVMIYPTIGKSSITGTVIYVNAAGNAITNITRDDFYGIGLNRRFEIMVQTIRNKITRIGKHSHKADPGELLAWFNAFDYLEIAVSGGRLDHLPHFSVDSNIIIKFLDKNSENQ